MGKLNAWALEYGMFDDDGPTQEQHDCEVMAQQEINEQENQHEQE